MEWTIPLFNSLSFFYKPFTIQKKLCKKVSLVGGVSFHGLCFSAVLPTFCGGGLPVLLCVTLRVCKLITPCRPSSPWKYLVWIGVSEKREAIKQKGI